MLVLWMCWSSQVCVMLCIMFIFSQCYDLDRGKEIKQNARCIFFLISSLLWKIKRINFIILQHFFFWLIIHGKNVDKLFKTDLSLCRMTNELCQKQNLYFSIKYFFMFLNSHWYILLQGCTVVDNDQSYTKYLMPQTKHKIPIFIIIILAINL